MPKNKKFGIDIEIDDNGTLKETGRKAKKTSGQFDVLSQSSRQADRAGKGLARTSSNSTKNFSKMAQGISGGLVPAYAVMAANIFALGAAFRFLQDAMETRNMIEGQKAFGSITGIAYQTITQSVRDATEGMLEFKDASEAVAIGTAAGLSADALTKLGGAAKNVSLALGRDLADSFQRLIRGVTKAEPELLDELGIVLRLENATRKYALTIGKTKEELNAYERTQAVLNDVLEQAERKFGRIAEIMDPKAFAFSQLTTDMDDMLVGFKQGLATTMIPVLIFLKENILVLVGVIGAVLIPILKAIGPNFSGMATKAKISMGNIQGSIVATKMQMIAFSDVTKKTGKALTAFVKTSRMGSAEGLSKLFGQNLAPGKSLEGFTYKQGGGLSARNTQQLNQKQIDSYRNMIVTKTGLAEGFTATEQRLGAMYLAQQEATLAVSVAKQEAIRQGGMTKRKLRSLKFQAWWKTQQLKMLNFSIKMQNLMAKHMGKIQGAMIFAMVAQMAFSGGKAFVNWLTPDSIKARRDETDKLISSLKSINAELDRMQTVRNMGLLGIKDGVEQLGGAMQSVDIIAKVQQFNVAFEGGYVTGMGPRAKKTRKGLKELGEQLVSMDKEFEQYLHLFSGDQGMIELTSKEGKAMVALANDIINASEASKRFDENQQNVKKSMDSITRSITKLPYQNLAKALDVSMAAIDLARPARLKEVKKQETRQTGLEDLQKQGWGHLQGGALGGGDKDIYKPGLAPWGKVYRKQMVDGIRQTIELTEEEYLLRGKTAEEYKEYIDKKLKSIDEELELEAEKEKIYARQYTMREKLMVIQAKGLEILKTEIANTLTLAKLGPGSSVYIKKAQAQKKLDDQISKEQKQGQEIGIAIIAKENREQEIRDKHDNAHNVALRDQRRTQKGASKEFIENLELQTKLAMEKELAKDQELKGAKAAVGVAEDQFELEKQLTINARIQHNWDIKAIEAAQLKYQISLSILAIQRQINAAKRVSEDPALYGFAKAAAGRVSKRAGLVGKQDIATSNIGYARDAMTKAGFSDKEIMSPEAIPEGQAGTMKKSIQAIKALNEMLTARENYRQVEHQIYLMDVEHLFSQKNALKQENEILAIQNERGTTVNPAELIFLQKKIAFQQTGLDIALFNAEQVMHLSMQQAEHNRDSAMIDLKAEHNKFKAKANIIYTLNPAEQLFQEKLIAWEAEHGKADIGRINALRQMAVEEKKLTIVMDLMSGMQDAMSQGFKDMFLAMVDGTKSFKDAMKGLFADFMQKMANMMAEAFALNMMMKFTGGLFGGATASTVVGGRSGGVFSPPGYKSFQGGGVSSGPNSGYLATLHGNEAVVPLGNDKSIPVKFDKSGGYKETNITVNVVAGGQQQTTTMKAGERERKLGQLVATAVQAEILDQQRPGGILSPYGDGSI